MPSKPQTEIDWSLLRSFLAVAEAGSMSRGAQTLGSSQPTLSRQMAALEQHLGQALFERTTRGLALTAAARALLPAARRMRESAAELALAAAGQQQSVAGTVRLTASEIVSAYLLPDVVVNMRQAHPEIQVELVASNEAEDLLQRDADIALRMFRPMQPALVARKLADWPVDLYAHRRYIVRHGMPSLQTLHRHCWIGQDRGDQYLQGFRAAGLEVEREFFDFRCDNQIVGWQAMRAGLGIGAGLRRVAAKDAELVRVLPEVPIAPLPVWLTAHRELKSTPRLRLVFDALAAAFTA